MSTVASFCRNCGKALTDEEKAIEGRILCAACTPAVSPAEPPPAAFAPALQPPTAAGSKAPSPGLAFLLGLIPGVGAIYNGQYAKGLVHVFIFGVLISIADQRSAHGEFFALFPLMVAAFGLYMPFEAYHTAKRRARGEAVDEFSSIVPINRERRSITGPAALIVIGVIFLLNNLEILRLSQVVRYWPAGLIALGVYLLITRLQGKENHHG